MGGTGGARRMSGLPDPPSDGVPLDANDPPPVVVANPAGPTPEGGPPTVAGTPPVPSIGRDMDTGFAPEDRLDHRRPGDWESKYPPEARKEQKQERTYLVVLLVAALVLTMGLLVAADQGWGGLGGDAPGVTEGATDSTIVGAAGGSEGLVLPALAAFLGGLLGGCLFSIKWLYHSVAKLVWHLDRRFWRTLTPWISAALAMAVVLLVAGDVVSVLDSEAIRSLPTAYGFGFLIGYFSDTALAKLAELALTLFGRTERGD